MKSKKDKKAKGKKAIEEKAKEKEKEKQKNKKKNAKEETKEREKIKEASPKDEKNKAKAPAEVFDFQLETIFYSETPTAIKFPQNQEFNLENFLETITIAKPGKKALYDIDQAKNVYVKGEYGIEKGYNKKEQRTEEIEKQKNVNATLVKELTNHLQSIKVKPILEISAEPEKFQEVKYEAEHKYVEEAILSPKQEHLREMDKQNIKKYKIIK